MRESGRVGGPASAHPRCPERERGGSASSIASVARSAHVIVTGEPRCCAVLDVVSFIYLVPIFVVSLFYSLQEHINIVDVVDLYFVYFMSIMSLSHLVFHSSVCS